MNFSLTGISLYAMCLTTSQNATAPKPAVPGLAAGAGLTTSQNATAPKPPRDARVRNAGLTTSQNATAPKLSL